MPGTTEPETVSDTEGSTPLPHPSTGRTPTACCVAAIVVASLALAVAGFLPWQADVGGWAELAGSQAGFRTTGEQVAVVLLAPTVLLWLVALASRHAVVRRLALLCTGVTTAFLLFTALAPPGGQTAPGVGMGLAVFGYPAALLAGGALEVLAGRRRTGRPSAIVVVGTVIVLGVGFGFGARWFAGGRILDATTATAEPAVDARGAAPGAVLWQQPLAADGIGGPQVAILAGGLVALRTEPGRVAVRDPATGVERWHYARAGSGSGGSGGLVATADGRTLVVDFAVRGRDFVVALDSATGTVRWQRWQPTGTATFLLSTAVTTVPDGVAAFGHQATAADPATGRTLWSASLGAWCHQASGLAGAADLTVVLTPCHTYEQHPADSALGIRAIGPGGRVRWQSTIARGVPVDPSDVLFADQDAIAVHGPTGADVFDPVSGRLIMHTDDEQPLAAGGARLVLSAPGRIVVREGSTASLTQPQPDADLVPPGGGVLAADVRVGSAYVLVAGQDGRAMRLVDIDLKSGSTVGTWPLPAAFGARYATRPVSVRAGDGVVVVAGLARDSSASVAVRVP